ncbi:rhamnan synthesis F family protein [Rhizobium tumorigenes]|uniref:rhamnan synthesis F family protein n=1 Tax=Rhizobium tumorigenes TaxID=2041385 RepID=UPI0024203124|nr:rhamnan synthesis F family protein [Rhizobium tumorigenes]WFS03264.1 rhamnan synthesis F family protein [Rhizobium tumorigenes]
MTQQTDKPAEFTIFVHVFYPEVWEEMRLEIADVVRQPFGLVVTRPPGIGAVAIPDTSFLTFSCQIELENRGRDILPFLRALRHPDLPQTDIGLKLHTKRSPHRSDGADWRRFMCRSLLETDGQDASLGHKLLAQEKRIALVAPQAHLMPLNGRTSINDGIMSGMLAGLFGPDMAVDVTATRFAAGSMFWFRRSPLTPLLTDDIEAQFAAEHGQLDGTAAHALERLFSAIVVRQGFLSCAMENAVPVLEAPSSTLSTAQLADLIERTLIRENPFSLPIRDFWRKNPRLLRVAHAIYARLPKGIIRVLRKAIQR